MERAVLRTPKVEVLLKADTEEAVRAAIRSFMVTGNFIWVEGRVV